MVGKLSAIVVELPMTNLTSLEFLYVKAEKGGLSCSWKLKLSLLLFLAADIGETLLL